ncbi:MAG: NAD(P)H-dependent oxidoreductase [Chitinophagaceae bacterium]|nr:NAD(P)H-dependent oxidoreductase [Chitinophagaceae bacterium]
MARKKSFVAICGSTRTQSSNLSLLKAIATLMRDEIDLKIFTGIATLPHFNPDLEHPTPPEAITQFRGLLRAADAILICTPEYAMGVPGSLKNSIDWTVSSCEFSKKPTALITASSLGYKGHQSLMETLRIIEANVTNHTNLVISYIKTKVSPTGEITDTGTKEQILHVMHALVALTDHPPFQVMNNQY